MMQVSWMLDCRICLLFIKSEVKFTNQTYRWNVITKFIEHSHSTIFGNKKGLISLCAAFIYIQISADLCDRSPQVLMMPDRKYKCKNELNKPHVLTELNVTPILNL